MFSSSTYHDTSSRAPTAEPADSTASAGDPRSGDPKRTSVQKKKASRLQEREGSSQKKSYMLFEQDNIDDDEDDNGKQVRL